MIGTILWWLAATAGTGLLGFLGYKGVKKLRARKNRKAKAEILGAVKAARTARQMTPRGQKRAHRKAQPKRITFGHRRTPDDPTRTRNAVAGVVNKVKTSAANRKAAAVDKPRTEPVTQRILHTVIPQPAPIPGHRTDEQVEATMTTCQAYAETTDGKCHNPALRDEAGNSLYHCWLPKHATQFKSRRTG
jgi:hypothetical protein